MDILEAIFSARDGHLITKVEHSLDIIDRTIDLYEYVEQYELLSPN